MELRPNRRIGITAVAIGLAAGFLLCGYELIRASSTSLYIGAFGSGRLPYAMFGGTVLTLLLLVGYGFLLSRVGPRRTLLLTTLFSGLMIAACYTGAQLGRGAGAAAAAAAAYAWREAYIVVIIEQYWSFINSTLREEEARGFNGLICGVASLGAVAGAFAAKYLAGLTGTESLLLLAAVSLIPAAVGSDVAYRLGGEPAAAGRKEERREKSDGSGVLAWRLFANSAYLRRIGLLIVLTQVVSTALDLGFFTVVEQALPAKDVRTAFIGGFYGRLNLAAAALQFVVTPLLLRRWALPLRVIHPAIPLLHVGAAIVLLLHPTLTTAGFAFLLFKALDYSVFRAGKEIFYMPLSFDSRYRAKELIDAFGYRAAKGLAAGLSSVARSVFGVLPLATYPITVIGCAAVWLVTVTQVARDHHRLTTTDGGATTDRHG